MRVAQLLAVAAIAGLAATAGCERRRGYQPPAASYTAVALGLADSGTASPPERVRGAAVTPAFFAAESGAPLPLLGRVFQPADYRPGAEGLIVLGHRLWQRRYGARPQVIGTRIRVNGRPATVVGVMAREFDAPPGTDAWVPRTDTDAAAATPPRSTRRDAPGQADRVLVRARAGRQPDHMRTLVQRSGSAPSFADGTHRDARVRAGVDTLCHRRSRRRAWTACTGTMGISSRSR